MFYFTVHPFTHLYLVLAWKTISSQNKMAPSFLQPFHD